jgi:hypothetical protein
VIGCSIDGLDIRRVIMLLCDIEASRLVLKKVQLGISATNGYEFQNLESLPARCMGGEAQTNEAFHPLLWMDR